MSEGTSAEERARKFTDMVGALVGAPAWMARDAVNEVARDVALELVAARRGEIEREVRKRIAEALEGHVEGAVKAALKEAVGDVLQRIRER